MNVDNLRVGVIGPVLSFSGTSTHTKRISQGLSLDKETFSCLITYIEPNSVIPVIRAPKIEIYSQNTIFHEVDLRDALDEETVKYAPGLKNEALQKINVPVYIFDKPITLENFGLFAEYISYVFRKEELNVLHPQIKPFVLFATYLASEMLSESGVNVNVVGTWHSNFGWIKDAKYHLALALMGSRVLRGVIPVSKNVKEDLKNFLHLNEYHILSIIPPGGIDYEALQKNRALLLEDLRKKYFIPKSYIVFLGRLLYNKGVDVLLEAYAGLSENDPPALVILGSGPFRDQFIQKAKELGLGVFSNQEQHFLEEKQTEKNSHKVFFLSGLSDDEVYAFLQGAVLYALPSRWESFSISTLEAMAAGAPVICTKVGGLAYWVGDSAHMIPKDDPAVLRKAIEKLLADEELREALKKKGKKTARTYDWRELAKNTAQAIRDSIERMQHPPKIPCSDDLVFDSETGIIRFQGEPANCESMPRIMKISSEALFFPSETLENGLYYIPLEEGIDKAS